MVEHKKFKDFFESSNVLERSRIEPITVEASMNIDHAINVMKEHNVSVVGVTNFGKFIGMLTEKDLLQNIVYKHANTQHMIVDEIMSNRR